MFELNDTVKILCDNKIVDIGKVTNIKKTSNFQDVEVKNSKNQKCYFSSSGEHLFLKLTITK